MSRGEIDYEGLGRLLARAGVEPRQAGRIVSDVLQAEACATRDLLAQEVTLLIEAELGHLRRQQKEIADDARRAIARIRIEMEVYRRVLAQGCASRNRMIAGIVAVQAILALAALAALLLWPAAGPELCGAFAMSAGQHPSGRSPGTAHVS